MILLTDEEIRGLETMVLQEVTNPSNNNTEWEWVRKKLVGLERDKEVAKAQLKRVVEWGDERCPHTQDFDGIEKIPVLLYKRFCGKCWQAVLEEVKE